MFIAFWNWFGPETTTSAYYYDHVDDFIKLWLLVHDTKWNCFFMIFFFQNLVIFGPKKTWSMSFQEDNFFMARSFFFLAQSSS